MLRQKKKRSQTIKDSEERSNKIKIKIKKKLRGKLTAGIEHSE